MFSQLGPLFKTTLRQAEKSDTRLEIRREEKESQGKKQDFEEESVDTSALWEDSTEVSVEALRTFLIEFLKTRGDDTGGGATAQPSAASATPAAPAPTVSPVAARAVQAYASTASHTVHAPPEPEMEEEETGDLADLLKADELRTIHVLIHELDVLARRGIGTLTIEKADTFLEALVQAVRLQKESL